MRRILNFEKFNETNDSNDAKAAFKYGKRRNKFIERKWFVVRFYASSNFIDRGLLKFEAAFGIVEYSIVEKYWVIITTPRSGVILKIVIRLFGMLML